MHVRSLESVFLLHGSLDYMKWLVLLFVKIQNCFTDVLPLFRHGDFAARGRLSSNGLACVPYYGRARAMERGMQISDE